MIEISDIRLRLIIFPLGYILGWLGYQWICHLKLWFLTSHLRVLSHQTQPSWRRRFLRISPLPPTQVFISCESVALFCEMTHECIIKQEEEFALQQTPKSLLLFKTWSAKSWPMKRMVSKTSQFYESCKSINILAILK